MDTADNRLLEMVDARIKVAGLNRLEILLFSLGTSETFGIDVFNVREVSKTPRITRAPNMPNGVEGLIFLRGKVIPVASLHKAMQLQGMPEELGAALMVTDHCKRTLGFRVHAVDRIIRVAWDKVRVAEGVLSSANKSIMAITELPNGHLASILDVGSIHCKLFGEAPVGNASRFTTVTSSKCSS